MPAFFSISHMQEFFPLLLPFSLMLYSLYNLERNRLFLSSSFFYSIVFLMFYVVFLMLINGSIEIDASYIGGDGRILYYLIFCFMMSIFITSSGQVLKLIDSYTKVAAGIALVSILLALSTGGIQFGESTIGVMEKSRAVLVGLLGTKNPFGGVTGSALLSIIVLNFARFSPNLKLAYFLMAVLFVALILSGSRGFSLGVLVAATYYFMFEVKMKTSSRMAVFIAISIMSVTGLALYTLSFSEYLAENSGDPDLNVIRRLALFEYTLSQIALSPLFGLGPGVHSMLNVEHVEVIPLVLSISEGGFKPDVFLWEGDLPIGQHAHNVVLQLLVDVGLIGTFIFFYFPLRSLFFTGYKPGSENDILSKLGRVQFVYLFISGMVAGYTMFTPTISFLYMVLISYLGVFRGR